MTSKRTFASPDGSRDLAWWTTYFGVEDTAVPRDAGGLGDYVCLTRYTAYALPGYFGVHFPESSVTETGAANLTEWAAVKRASTGGDLSRYSAFLTQATGLWVSALDAHVAAFERDGVDFLRRTFANDADGATIYVATVAAPASFAVFEVMSDSCGTCEGWAAYGAHEQPSLRGLAGQRVSDVALRYAVAAADAYESSAGGLPAAMLLQMRVAVSDLARAERYVRAVFPDLALANGTASSFSATVETAAYDLGGAASGDDVEIVFATRANASGAAFDAYEAYVDAVHAENLDVGDASKPAGGGMDRYVDDHIRISDDAIPLDTWAAAHVERGLRYHAYNWTRSCPGADLSFPGGFMIYSQGVGAQAIELGTSRVDASLFGPDDLWALDPCAASYECRVLDDDDDDFSNMAPFAVFLSQQLNLTIPSALALGIYFAASAVAVGAVFVASNRVKRNHVFDLKVRGSAHRDYHRIKEVVEI